MRTLVLLSCLALVASCSKENKNEPSPPATPESAKPAAANRELATATPHGARPPPSAMMQPGPAAAKNDQGRYRVGKLALNAPDDWTSQPTTSRMRSAQFALPAAKGDTDPTELVVYHFGNRGAGSVEANLDRWYGQFTQADGSDSKTKANIENIEVAGMKVTTVDLSGHYVAAMAPGSAQSHDKPNHRMLAAIVEADDGAYYFKIVGPETSVAAQANAFLAAIKTIQ